MPAIIDYSGRFKVWDRPAVYPQVDLVNGAPEGPVFDLDVNREDGGATYLRVDHVEEMARTLGWISPEDAQILIAENETLKNQIFNLPNAIEELKDGIDDRVRDFFDRLDYRPRLDMDSDESSDESTRSGGEIESDSGISGDTSESDNLESFGLGISEGPNELSGNSVNGKSRK